MIKWVAQVSEYWPISKLAATSEPEMHNLLSGKGMDEFDLAVKSATFVHPIELPLCPAKPGKNPHRIRPPIAAHRRRTQLADEPCRSRAIRQACSASGVGPHTQQRKTQNCEKVSGQRRRRAEGTDGNGCRRREAGVDRRPGELLGLSSVLLTYFNPLIPRKNTGSWNSLSWHIETYTSSTVKLLNHKNCSEFMPAKYPETPPTRGSFEIWR